MCVPPPDHHVEALPRVPAPHCARLGAVELLDLATEIILAFPMRIGRVPPHRRSVSPLGHEGCALTVAHGPVCRGSKEADTLAT